MHKLTVRTKSWSGQKTKQDAKAGVFRPQTVSRAAPPSKKPGFDDCETRILSLYAHDLKLLSQSGHSASVGKFREMLSASKAGFRPDYKKYSMDMSIAPDIQSCDVRIKKGDLCNMDDLMEQVAKPWTCIVCFGREVVKHVFMRGAAAPALEMLLGNPLKVLETPAPVLVFPDVLKLAVVEGDPNDFRFNAVKELREKEAQMQTAISAFKKIIPAATIEQLKGIQNDT